jgi:hypothetical protein
MRTAANHQKKNTFFRKGVVPCVVVKTAQKTVPCCRANTGCYAFVNIALAAVLDHADAVSAREQRPSCAIDCVPHAPPPSLSALVEGGGSANGSQRSQYVPLVSSM